MDAQDLLHKLQKETDRLKNSLDELDRNQDLKVRCPLRTFAFSSLLDLSYLLYVLVVNH